MTLNEEWKDISGYEGLYKVSNLGRIWSNEKVVTVDYRNNWRAHIDYFTYTMPGKFMKLYINSNGYVTVGLTKDKKQKGYMVHRLVAEAFLPKIDPDKTQINHIDENKQNNCVSNLEWCTAKENVNYGTCIIRRSFKQRFTNKNRRPIISIDEQGNETEYLSTQDASRKIGAAQSNIWHAINKGTKCSGYYWRYKEVEK